MQNPLTKRLERYVALGKFDRRMLDDIVAESREVAAGEHVVGDGDDPQGVRLIIDGFACRYKTLPDGKRQIVAYMIPGDFCDLYAFVLGKRNRNIAAISTCRVVDISPERIATLMSRPSLGRALWRTSLVDESILSEWIVNIGARAAEARIAHFICEMILRLQIVGLADLTGGYLPITQSDLADTLGLSLVHTNRSLQHLRARGLFTLNRSRLDIPDFDRLAEISFFDRAYLHLDMATDDTQQAYLSNDVPGEIMSSPKPPV
jgi:CRP-like cAMP-binding protein